MSESLITKKRIAKAFKIKVLEKSFEKVTVSDIMRESHMRRQTFYDHFQDKYELMDWIFDQEAYENINDYLTYEDWRKVLFRLMDYLERNKRVYRQVLTYNGQNSFRDHYTVHLLELVEMAFQESEHYYAETAEESKVFIKEFYVAAIVEMTSKWLVDDCTPEPGNFSQKLQFILEEAFRLN